MDILSNPLSAWTNEDIETLIELSIEENINLDYKETLPGRSDSDRKEFLNDITSFANSQGGFLIFGVSEKLEEKKKTNKPGTIQGIDKEPSQEMSRLDQILSSGVYPRFTDYSFRSFKFAEDKHVVVFQLAKSWIGPHMVTADGSNKFFTRAQTGKQPMDYSQIRSAFLGSESTLNNIRNFISERRLKIRRNEGPLSIEGPSSLVVHVVPVETFNHLRFSVRELKADNFATRQLTYRDGISEKANLEGLCRYNPHFKENGFAQIFRSGIHEFADVGSIDVHGENTTISLGYLGDAIFTALKNSFDNLGRLGLNGPAVVGVSITGIKDRKLTIGQDSFNFFADRRFDRTEISLPEVYIENGNYTTQMKDIMEPLCNSAGIDTCPFISLDGTWDRKGRY